MYINKNRELANGGGVAIGFHRQIIHRDMSHLVPEFFHLNLEIILA